MRARVLVVAGLLGCWSLPAAARTVSDATVDRRGHEQVLLDCSSGELRRAVSLFANGTVRIRDEGGRDPGMRLGELEPGELQAFQNRIAEIDLSEVTLRVRGPSSETLEQCRLRLELTHGEVTEYRFPKLVALPLALSRLITVIDDVVALADERSRAASGLPLDYEPRVGDVLVKRDGSRHRVVRVTADGGGVEIVSLESPLVIYLPMEGVRGEFSEVEGRRRPVARRRQ